jgi:hypothetical protein
MISLARQLGETAPCSYLLRKARLLGVVGLDAFVELASLRGCDHYRPSSSSGVQDPGQERLPDEELTILLLLGENAYAPNAVRCAAQLARSPGIVVGHLAELAIRHKTSRVLSHIAHAGSLHDPEGTEFWKTLFSRLPSASFREPEVDLPHWSRFVSMPGLHRNGPAPIRWLTPRA